MRELTNDQTRHLRRLGHALKPVVLMGQSGLTRPVLGAIDEALTDHELIKVRLSAGDRPGRRDQIDAIVEHTGASEVQFIGQIVLLFRRSGQERKRRIALP